MVINIDEWDFSWISSWRVPKSWPQNPLVSILSLGHRWLGWFWGTPILKKPPCGDWWGYKLSTSIDTWYLINIYYKLSTSIINYQHLLIFDVFVFDTWYILIFHGTRWAYSCAVNGLWQMNIPDTHVL